MSVTLRRMLSVLVNWNLTSGTSLTITGNIHGVFNIQSEPLRSDADLVNDRTWDTTKSNYGYGLFAMNSDGHLTINGNGDNDNGFYRSWSERS